MELGAGNTTFLDRCDKIFPMTCETRNIMIMLAKQTITVRKIKVRVYFNIFKEPAILSKFNRIKTNMGDLKPIVIGIESKPINVAL